MAGHLGFSYVGLLFLLMLSVPNVVWAIGKPQGYVSGNENKVLLCLERAGEILTTICLLIFDDFNFHGWSGWTWWLVAAFVAMVMYECWWICYFRGGRRQSDFYSSFAGIPLAGATLPVIAFFLLGIYGKVVWLLLAATIFGIGHIRIHFRHRKEIQCS